MRSRASDWTRSWWLASVSALVRWNAELRLFFLGVSPTSAGTSAAPSEPASS